MLSPIQEKYDGLRKKRQDLLQRLNSLSSEVLSFKAGPDKWSIVEVVEHGTQEIFADALRIDYGPVAPVK